MKSRLWLPSLLALAIASVRAAEPAASAAEAPAPAAEAEPTPHQKLYFFQHRLLPQWTHQSDGAFYADLWEGRTERLVGASRRIVGDAFGEKLGVEKVDAPEGVLVRFATPEEPADCFFVFLAKTGGQYRFFTFERAEDITNEGLVACIGEWGADGGHRNFGFSTEDTREAFLKVVAGLLREPETAPGAVTHPRSEASE